MLLTLTLFSLSPKNIYKKMQENYLNDQFLLLLVVIKIKVLIFVSNGLLKQNILISVNQIGRAHV